MRACFLAISALTLACSPSTPDVDDSDPIDVTPGEDTQPLPFVPPNEHGSFKAGVKTIQFTDPRGKLLTLEVWYPAVIQEGDAPSPYREITIALEGYRDAQPAKAHAPYPLIAFSHGLGGIRYQSAFLTEYLAEQGFVVVAPDHDGSVLINLDTKHLAENFLQRPDDIRYAVDHVLERSAGSDDPTLSGMIAGPGYTMIGQSLGSLTTLILGGAKLDFDALLSLCDDHPEKTVCTYLAGTTQELSGEPHGTRDDRINALIPLSTGGAYAFYPDGSGLSDVMEVFMMGGDVDKILGYDDEQQMVWDHLPSPKQFVTLHGAGHYSAFSDLCHIFPPTFQDCGGEEAGYLDMDKGQAITRTLVTAYIKSHVLKDERYDEWLNADHLEDPDVVTWQHGDDPAPTE